LNVVKYATAARMVPVVVENIHTKEKTEYGSVREAALALGMHNQSLSYALRNNSIFKKTYLIRSSFLFFFFKKNKNLPGSPRVGQPGKE
jgi:hypothetical protein